MYRKWKKLLKVVNCLPNLVAFSFGRLHWVVLLVANLTQSKDVICLLTNPPKSVKITNDYTSVFCDTDVNQTS